jgi:U3 small nucleolar RNA-associated protein 6
VFGIFERGVMKHPGSVELWIYYLEACDAAGAGRRWRKVVTRAVRMHPREGRLWVLAGKRAASMGNMSGARGWFMRGCRFANGVGVWVEYARYEMEWLARVERRKGRGNKKALLEEMGGKKEDDGEIRFEDEDMDDDDRNENGELVLADLDRDSTVPKRDAVFDEEAVKKLEKSPALEGAIPIAVYDISLKERWANAATSEAFFEMFAGFTHVASQPKILQHVLDSMSEQYPTDAATFSCLVRQPLVGVDAHTAEYPKALRESMARLRRYMKEGRGSSAGLARRTITWIDPVLADDNLDEGLRMVLDHLKAELDAA